MTQLELVVLGTGSCALRAAQERTLDGVETRKEERGGWVVPGRPIGRRAKFSRRLEDERAIHLTQTVYTPAVSAQRVLCKASGKAPVRRLDWGGMSFMFTLVVGRIKPPGRCRTHGVKCLAAWFSSCHTHLHQTPEPILAR